MRDGLHGSQLRPRLHHGEKYGVEMIRAGAERGITPQLEPSDWTSNQIRTRGSNENAQIGRERP
jgi:hypothetical protein